MVNNPISDILIRIKNAQLVRHEQVTVPFSKAKFAIANILKSAGYISEVERKKKSAKGRKAEHEYLVLALKYQDSSGAISGIKIISRPSRRIYIKAGEIRPVRSGHGLAVISTSKGILNSQEAKKQKLGGEILFEIW